MKGTRTESWGEEGVGQGRNESFGEGFGDRTSQVEIGGEGRRWERLWGESGRQCWGRKRVVGIGIGDQTGRERLIVGERVVWQVVWTVRL